MITADPARRAALLTDVLQRLANDAAPESRERLLAWVSLYRAMGGGWTPQANEHLAGRSDRADTLVPGSTPSARELARPQSARR